MLIFVTEYDYCAVTNSLSAYRAILGDVLKKYQAQDLGVVKQLHGLSERRASHT